MKLIKCPACDGSGYEDSGGAVEVCGKCDGQGKVGIDEVLPYRAKRLIAQHTTTGGATFEMDNGEHLYFNYRQLNGDEPPPAISNGTFVVVATPKEKP